MNKKSLITMLVALCLVAAVGVGATLAYFTDKADVKNTVTMSHVDIAILENGNEMADGQGLTFNDVLPGNTVEKKATVLVKEGSADCFVRVKVEFDGNAPLTDADKTALLAGIKADDWTLADGYYYYNGIMEAEQTADLFTTVVIPTGWGNAYADKTFNIIIKAEAIQADIAEVETAEDAFAALGDAQVEKYNAPVAADAVAEPIG